MRGNPLIVVGCTCGMQDTPLLTHDIYDRDFLRWHSRFPSPSEIWLPLGQWPDASLPCASGCGISFNPQCVCRCTFVGCSGFVGLHAHGNPQGGLWHRTQRVCRAWDGPDQHWLCGVGFSSCTVSLWSGRGDAAVGFLALGSALGELCLRRGFGAAGDLAVQVSCPRTQTCGAAGHVLGSGAVGGPPISGFGGGVRRSVRGALLGTWP